ncbi:hypothetical protein J1N35_024074 [Gossypium stocksii]|uniref:Uncharacterized protein n=1 Tax=Gossypium stocksii TaxID=47602 RepID=A0A9D3VJP6_9ROSI|nr:hypothetical protein J1N35_024074 [Gossypium stocksii]
MTTTGTITNKRPNLGRRPPEKQGSNWSPLPFDISIISVFKAWSFPNHRTPSIHKEIPWPLTNFRWVPTNDGRVEGEYRLLDLLFREYVVEDWCKRFEKDPAVYRFTLG